MRNGILLEQDMTVDFSRRNFLKGSFAFGGRQEEALRDSLAWAKEHVDYVVHTKGK